MNTNIDLNTARTELVDRYVYAVVRRLPRTMRDDVDKELRSIIDDTLEARCGDVEPTEHDVRVVLTELGTPSELSNKYDPAGDRFIISPKYYRAYTRVTTIVLLCVAAGLAISGIINCIVTPPESILMTFVEQLGIFWSGLLQGFALCTLIFAILEIKNVSIADDDLSKLPPVPQKNELIKRSECIFGIVFNTFFLVLMCFAPQYLGIYRLSSAEGNEIIPIFNGELIRSMWLIWVLFFILGTGCELVKMIIGRYNRTVALVTILADALSALLCCFAFLRRDIMNPAFTARIGELFAEEAGSDVPALVVAIFTGFNYFLLGVILFALLLDCLTAVVRAIRYSGNK